MEAFLCALVAAGEEVIVDPLHGSVLAHH